jgi:hypothetical protein
MRLNWPGQLSRVLLTPSGGRRLKRRVASTVAFEVGNTLLVGSSPNTGTMPLVVFPKRQSYLLYYMVYTYF